MSRKTPSKTTAGAKKATASTPAPSRQTHGGYTPVSGPITSVRQLIRSPNVARGSIGGFATLESYATYLRGLSMAELHRHAIEEAHIVAIDDRDRLIKRLESEWSGHNAREGSSTVAAAIPKRAAFTAEQTAAQEAIKKKLLNGRG